MIFDVLHILFVFVFIYSLIIILYLLIASIAGLLSRRAALTPASRKKNIAVLITAFREDNIIINTVKSATEHNYPEEHFDIYVAADQLQSSTIDAIKKFRASIFEVNFSNSSKARSINFLLNKIDESAYDIALILDSDNIMLPGFLEKVNAEFQNGGIAVQGHRMAKNLQTSIAVLDAISEEVNNHLFRNSQSALGFSASLIGSGMAFPFASIKKVYNKPGILDNPACDREVDFEMMKSDIHIKYIPDAYVLDEKVSKKNIYENQRRRWLESQAMHLGLFFSEWKQIKNKSHDFWNKLFINLLPPRILLLCGFFFIFLILVIQRMSGINILGISYKFWLLLFAAYILSILLSIPGRFFNLRTLIAFLHLPTLLFSFVKAVFTIRFNRKEFVHTPKSFTGNSATTEKRE